MIATQMGGKPHGRSSDPSLVRLADAAELSIVLLLYLGLVGRLIAHASSSGRIASLPLLASEGLVVAFLVVRRPATRLSMNWREWTLALAATLLPLLVRPATGRALAPPAVGALGIIAGTIIQVHAKLTLGRSFGCVPACRGLQFSGPYRFVRHPMYAGYLISHAAFLLMNPSLANVALYGACYAAQIPRLLAEERLLAQDRQYREYQRKVPYRLVPGVF